MIAIFFVLVIAAVSLNPTEQVPTPQPEPTLVVIEKTVVIECIPIKSNERLERDLTRPFEQRHYFNPQGDGCRKRSETSTISTPQVTDGTTYEQRNMEGEREP